MTPEKCKFCGSIPKVRPFGGNWSIYCPEASRCDYPPSLEGKELDKLIMQWNLQFGREDTKC